MKGEFQRSREIKEEWKTEKIVNEISRQKLNERRKGIRAKVMSKERGQREVSGKRHVETREDALCPAIDRSDNKTLSACLQRRRQSSSVDIFGSSQLFSCRW